MFLPSNNVTVDKGLKRILSENMLLGISQTLGLTGGSLTRPYGSTRTRDLLITGGAQWRFSKAPFSKGVAPNGFF
jgi:hypothetical protein